LKGKLFEVIEMLDKDSINLRMKCENCGKEITIDNKVANEMISSWFVACPNCQLKHNICKYFIDLGVAKMN
jgi:DNA-directed RNA polymerase subunit RPC12/RpoP